ncbi:phage antirepressor Ant [Salmonella enterica]|uniref:P22AR C-terminal domain-containing protein n=1 Tax=Salmonella enterica TaxID=28901 RepID=UPI0008FD7C73|nr:P22AR C-terminal domain-containing protein [Salmonella enterica]EAA2779989.1 phage antirepressor Ant [Salmonella enterica subsp. enterica serovar Montevideo]EDV1318023.1 phage antirepressor Ant [Salmonella enterica subsp. salamae]EED9448081.1 phage antirepressor Ant [Salmonella enterica subsp. enterica serovar Thompson]EHC7731385.1 phage antirepressor Ant [Salmonella enterica subsp. enterica serovar Braenderup]EIY9161147.1 KilA-N domain-containing protein [Salmonella enterica subsp. enteric
MTNQIIISDISIRQDSEGRYSLNDLHKAAGGEDKIKPAFWLRLDQVKEMVELLKVQICTFSPIRTTRGCKGCTYVCKELVYAYATWISAEFFLKVIRAYDALVSGDTAKAVAIAKTTVDDRTPLRSLVNRIMAKYGTTYQSVYKLVHREFGVQHIDELSPKQTVEAMEYLAAKAIEGEFLGKQKTLSTTSLSAREADYLIWLWDYANRSQHLYRELYPSMKQIRSEFAGKFYDYGSEFSPLIKEARKVLIRITRDVDINEPGGPMNLSAWIRLKDNSIPSSLR